MQNAMVRHVGGHHLAVQSLRWYMRRGSQLWTDIAEVTSYHTNSALALRSPYPYTVYNQQFKTKPSLLQCTLSTPKPSLFGCIRERVLCTRALAVFGSVGCRNFEGMISTSQCLTTCLSHTSYTNRCIALYFLTRGNSKHKGSIRILGQQPKQSKLKESILYETARPHLHAQRRAPLRSGNALCGALNASCNALPLRGGMRLCDHSAGLLAHIAFF